ncbi:two-component system response regulator [Rubellimicrobium mesophilum DSM 19309]|uniref:Two-component system response regulator n=1 Tax=Rubellimicrobium mesophilum DSM 19309 TaxID=442562 RepID=A0A017HX99_9RHOB|nr:response regulator transcription factor [Rubellimicrobium mesophilum]EYD78389.1 two-component system response regulator [Rubellimicrobium mesophilum DSM 19309]
MTPIRIVVADDHPLYREGVTRSLAESGRFAVVGEASNGAEAEALVARERPDVALLDMSMPGGGIATLRRILALPQPPRCAMLTVSEEDDDVMQALRAGALGYILKGVGARDLVGILSDLAEGRSYVAPSLAMKVLAAMNAPRAKKAETPLDTLTKREEDILRRVAEGKSNKEVARDLDLQEKTVKHYMTAILQKLQARNRTEAALIAREGWPGTRKP